MELMVNNVSGTHEIVLEVIGEVDVSNADILRKGIDKAISEVPESVVVDLGQVSYIDSTGIGVLVGAAHRLSENNIGFAVAHPQPNVLRVFTLLGVDSEFNIRS